MRMALRCLFIIATLVHFSAGQSSFGCSSDTSEITSNTEFQQNLAAVLSDDSYTSSYLSNFFNSSVGTDPNKAYATAHCIGFIDYYATADCIGCIQGALGKLKEDCVGTTNSAIIWYRDHCFFQYSNHFLFGRVTMPDDMIFISNNTDDLSSDYAEAFNKARTDLFNALASRTKDLPLDNQKFATAKWYDRLSNQTIYAATQCSHDLSAETCGNCLDIVRQKLEDYFYGKVGGNIVGPSCNFQYDIKSFVNDSSLVIEDLSPPSPQPSPEPQPTASASPLLALTPTGGEAGKVLVRWKKNHKALMAAHILFAVTGLGIIISIGIYFFRKLKHEEPNTELEIAGKVSDEDENIFEPDIKSEDTLQYDFPTISAATENFSEANKLGQGGFGAVYKGKLQNGDKIAVKRLSQNSAQGEVEFANEVTLLAKLQHRNLVRLLGFCLKRNERLLIYEFVVNSSLDNFIFDPIKRAHLNWDQLYKIIGGVARGLLYLHEDSRLRIIHRDLKSSNILLDNEMIPKIADFGMARLFLSDETHGSTSKIVGTYGYMAPEYAMHGQFSIKSDVFSFGVLLMEIICGRRNTFFRIEESVEDLLSYAWKNWQEGTVSNLIDPALKSETSSIHEVTRCIHIGLLCVQEDATQRPTTASVFNLLTNLSAPLPVPLKPAFFQPGNINQSTPLLQNCNSGVTGNSSGSKNKSSMSWSAVTELLPR